MGANSHEAEVVYVGVGLPGAVISEARNEIEAVIEGLVGDRHFGITKPSGVRERIYRRGTTIRNNRQFSATSAEELGTIAKALGLEELRPEWLGANLSLQGLPDLTHLPPLSRLVFPSGAVLLVYGENLPCKLPGEVIQHLYPEIPGLEPHFVKEAFGKRGVVGWIEVPGVIKLGDPVSVRLPKQAGS